MSAILRWILAGGILWFLVALGLTAYLAKIQAPANESNVQAQVVDLVLQKVIGWGGELGHFIAPVVQLALIVMILIVAAERFGFTHDKKAWGGFAGLGTANNVQALIAITIIGALVIGVLGGVDRIDVLKDLALVVVGFYFGTRRRQGEVEDAVAAGVASATQLPSPDSTPNPEVAERSL